ncbi:MAG: carbohydrate kinase [Aphanocapsa sp. GSE-SYN-MK-11-07L]|jgi:fructokinase|nr:carbohydrate kinase [Aphanocapsa sp. GSE-SYN-MK-11-07L]
MTHPQVICLGEVLWDYLADQVGKSQAEVSSWTAYLGGAPANVACGLVKLSTPAALISCVGQDPDGMRILEQLQQLGVEIGGIQQSAQATTRRVYVTRIPTDNPGTELVYERQFVGFGPLDALEFADRQLQAERLPEELFAGAKYLVLGTLGLAAPVTAKAMQRAIELARQHGLGIVIDVNWRPIFWPHPEAAIAQIRDFIQQADILKLSLEEAELFFQTTDPAVIQAGFGSHSSASSIQGAVITMGEQGCRYVLAEQAGQLSALPVQTVDTTGAGDGFLAGLLHQLCLLGEQTELSLDVAMGLISFASAVGALVTTKPGAIAGQPTASEVHLFLRQC